MQQIQDARNHVGQALYLLNSRDQTYQFKSGTEVNKLMDAVMLQLTRARNRLTTPAALTLPELASSSLMKMFTPSLPGDVFANFYINLSKLCLIVYQLHLLQPNLNKTLFTALDVIPNVHGLEQGWPNHSSRATRSSLTYNVQLTEICWLRQESYELVLSMNFKAAGSSVLHNPGSTFEINNQKYEVSHVHKVECVIPWLNDTLVFFTIALQLCQQLKDKISVFSNYWNFKPY
ncbi:protein rogdi homolog isoform X2 [Narcine bancroftii]|uniref:protein rogdi homolog isoform X2 n=1 Tax=Narcine bancroftii TaxID=1343680 RepID=UPI003832166F